MKIIVFLAALAFASVTWAQAGKVPAKEAAKPAAAAEMKPVAVQAKPAAEAKKSRRNEDARQCLEQPDNNAIIKCAEAFL
jgi:hypothetical protein